MARKPIRALVASLIALTAYAGAYSARASADEIAALTAATETDETDAIRKAIVAAPQDTHQDAAAAVLLLRAYFKYFDELAERDREADRKWAADAMYGLAEKARKAHPENPRVRYWSAMAGLVYLQTYTMKALFVAGDVMDEMELVRKLEPEIDDWGPDRVLGILYYSLPGWPLSRGKNDKALPHLAKAAQEAPQRAVNRIYYARALMKDGQTAKAKAEIAFLERGGWRVSSAHWKKITEGQIRELAEEVK